MKLRFPGLTAVAALAMILTHVPSFARDKFTELPAKLDGTMSLYNFEAVEPSALPDSLSPFSISYIARHGARYLSSENKVNNLEKRIAEARAKGSLTAKGDSLTAFLEEVKHISNGNWGMLSPAGIEEEQRLSQEMCKMFPEVFSQKKAEIACVSSYVPRVIQTMDTYTLEIARQFPGININTASGKDFSTLTRFFSTDSTFNVWRENGEWKAVYDNFVSRHVSTAPAKALLGEKSGLDDNQLRKFTLSLYGVLQGCRAMGLPAPTTFWMSIDQYRACWQATNLERYFRYSISPLSTIPARGAAPIMNSLMAQQELIANDSSYANGMTAIFGHAETLLPSLAILGIDTALPLDYDNLDKEWVDSDIAPLAANIAIIYSRSVSGNIYASMRLNGRNISPVNDSSRLIVPINELRDFWVNRLKHLFPAK